MEARAEKIKLGFRVVATASARRRRRQYAIGAHGPRANGVTNDEMVAMIIKPVGIKCQAAAVVASMAPISAAETWNRSAWASWTSDSERAIATL